MDKEAYNIPSFCAAYGIGRSSLYRLWRERNGPAVMRVGRRVLISREAADDWRKRLEAASLPGPEATQP